MSTLIQSLIDKRGKIHTQQKDILTQAKSNEGGIMTSDQTTQYEALDTEFDQLSTQISIHERAKKRDAEFADAEARKQEAEGTRAKPGDMTSAHRAAFKAYLSAKKDIDLTQEESRILKEYRGTNTQVTSTDSLGGYLVPQHWTDEIIASMLYTGGIIEAAGIYPTDTGGDMPINSYDDTAVKSAVITQGTADTVSDITISQVVLGAHTYTSGLILMSWEQLRDSNFERELISIIGGRHARGINYDATVGDTSGSQARGIVTDSAAGITGVAAIGVDDLLDLEHSVNLAYRKSLQCGWMMNDTTFKLIRKLKDDQGQPIFQASYREGETDSILGKRLYINNDMADATAASSNKPILYGDFSKYRLRLVKALEVVTLRERYAEKRSNGYFGYAGMDGRLLVTAAVKHLQMTAA